MKSAPHSMKKRRGPMPLITLLITVSLAVSLGGCGKPTRTHPTLGAPTPFVVQSPVFALVIDPAAPTTLYAGIDGVYKSTDGGGNWAAINTGLPKWATVTLLAMDPLMSTILYAGVSMNGLYKSTDGGSSWLAINTGLPYLNGGNVNALAIDPQAPTTLYAGTTSGVYKSTNGGGNWQAANTGMHHNAYTLAIDPSTPTTLYAGTGAGIFTYGVFKSTDGGENWQAINNGLTNTGVSVLAIDPVTPTSLYLGAWTEEVVAESRNVPGCGIFKSMDGGENWRAANTGITYTAIVALAFDPATPTTLYAGAMGGPLYKSINAGRSWRATSTTFKSDFKGLVIDPSAPNTLYVGGWGGVFKSTDGGATWQTVNTGLPEETLI